MNPLFRNAALMTALVAGGAYAAAADIDPATLYTLSTEGSTATIKAGEKGKFVLLIQPKPGAHVSEDAPLKLELSGSGAEPEKKKLTLADSLSKKAAGQKYVDPRFEIPFTVASGTKEAQVTGKLTFFICTDQICARQQKDIKLDVRSVGSL